MDGQVRRWKGRLKLMVFSLIPAAVLLVVAETYATLTIQRRATQVPASTAGDSVYIMRIGRLPWSRTGTVVLNRQGFPDDPFPAPGTKRDCFHVVFSGDSFVFGDGVDRDSSFVQIAKRELTARLPGRCIRVFNLGERATTIAQQAQHIRDTFGVLEPDLVILGQYQNDLIDLARLDDTPVEEPQVDVRDRVQAFNLNLVRFLSYRAFAVMIQRDIEYDALTYWSVVADTLQRERATLLMEDYERRFAELDSELAARGVLFGVVIIPSKFDILAGRFPEEEFFVRLAEKHRRPYLRIFPTLDTHRSPYAFLMYDGHLNERGNHLIADSLVDWLLHAEAPPFPALLGG